MIGRTARRNWRWGALLGVLVAGATFQRSRSRRRRRRIHTDWTSPPRSPGAASSTAPPTASCSRSSRSSRSSPPSPTGRSASGAKRALAGIGASRSRVSLLFTAVYHLGYADFRGEKVRKPLIGDVTERAHARDAEPDRRPARPHRPARQRRRPRVRHRHLPPAAREASVLKGRRATTRPPHTYPERNGRGQAGDPAQHLQSRAWPFSTTASFRTRPPHRERLGRRDLDAATARPHARVRLSDRRQLGLRTRT